MDSDIQMKSPSTLVPFSVSILWLKEQWPQAVMPYNGNE